VCAEAQAQQHSSSEEVDVVSLGDEEFTPHTVTHTQEELLEVVTRAVARLNLDWPASEQESCKAKSKLDERFLPSRSQPPKRGLPFFPDVHTEVSKSWIRPASFRVFNPATSEYSNIVLHCHRVQEKLLHQIWIRPGSGIFS